MTVCMAARHHYTKQHQRWKKRTIQNKNKMQTSCLPWRCALGLLTSVTSSPKHPQSQQKTQRVGGASGSASQVWVGHTLLSARLSCPPGLLWPQLLPWWGPQAEPGLYETPASSKHVVLYKGPQGLKPVTTCKQVTVEKG